MDRLQTATTQATQASVLATNKVLRNTYILLSATLLFSAEKACVFYSNASLVRNRGEREREVRSRVAVRYRENVDAVQLVLLPDDAMEARLQRQRQPVAGPQALGIPQPRMMNGSTVSATNGQAALRNGMQPLPS